VPELIAHGRMAVRAHHIYDEVPFDGGASPSRKEPR
jgi:hypothetical protein